MEADSLAFLSGYDIEILQIIIRESKLLQLLIKEFSVFIIWGETDTSERKIHKFLLFL